jgi:hypothetical protein
MIPIEAGSPFVPISENTSSSTSAYLILGFGMLAVVVLYTNFLLKKTSKQNGQIH